MSDDGTIDEIKQRFKDAALAFFERTNGHIDPNHPLSQTVKNAVSDLLPHALAAHGMDTEEIQGVASLPDVAISFYKAALDHLPEGSIKTYAKEHSNSYVHAFENELFAYLDHNPALYDEGIINLLTGNLDPVPV